MAKRVLSAFEQRWIRFVKVGMDHAEISSRQLAERAGIDPSNLCRYLNGSSSPTLRMCFRILSQLYDFTEEGTFIPYVPRKELLSVDIENFD